MSERESEREREKKKRAGQKVFIKNYRQSETKKSRRN